MRQLILHPTDISQWYALVNEAQAAAQLSLTANTESYLVFLLQKFSQNPTLLDSVLALDCLTAWHAPCRQKIAQLQDVGDRSLLLCGLFPGIAQRRHVTLGYYVNMGQAAYLTAAELYENTSADLFLQLGQHFEHLQKTLQSIRSESYQFKQISETALWLEPNTRTH